MEKIKIYKINLSGSTKYPQIGIPINWFREYFKDGDELELYQEGKRLILTPKKKEKAGALSK